MKKILGFLAVSVFALSFGIACSKKQQAAKEPEGGTATGTEEGTGAGTGYGTETPPPPEGGGE